MILFPAIDLKNGDCVRLLRGDMDASTTFNDNPAAQAKEFEVAGAEYLHIVDLNGAFEGKPVNEDAVKNILSTITIPAQLGGGIRSMETIDRWLSLGVSRVILGTAALHNADLVYEACDKYPGQIVVGIDSREGKVAVEGWAEKSEVPTAELGKAYENAGVAAIIYTDVGRDGAMEGPDLEGTEALLRAISTPVIASGGVSTLEDLRQLKQLEPFGLAGVISGRAIYDGAIPLKDGMNLLKQAVSL